MFFSVTQSTFKCDWTGAKLPTHSPHSIRPRGPFLTGTANGLVNARPSADASIPPDWIFGTHDSSLNLLACCLGPGSCPAWTRSRVESAACQLLQQYLFGKIAGYECFGRRLGNEMGGNNVNPSEKPESSPDEANTRSNRSTGRLCVDSGRRDCSAFSFQLCSLRVPTTAIVVRIRNITYTYAKFVSQFTCPIVRPINSLKLNKTFAVFVPGADLHGRHL